MILKDKLQNDSRINIGLNILRIINEPTFVIYGIVIEIKKYFSI